MGRPKSDDKLVPVMVRLAAAEVDKIDARRGDRSRSDYVRSVLTRRNPHPAEAPANPSEGGETDGQSPPDPALTPPSGKSSEGVGKNGEGSPPHSAPGDSIARPGSPDPPEPCCDFSDHSPGPCTCPDHDASTLHPFGGRPAHPERPPSDRQLTARVFAAMREVDPTDAGPVTTPEEATFLRQWAQRTLDAWKAVYAPPAPAEKPQRRQGTISRPQAAVLNGSNKGSPQAEAAMARLRSGQAAAAQAARIAKRHADDCSCLSCAPAKATAK